MDQTNPGRSMQTHARTYTELKLVRTMTLSPQAGSTKIKRGIGICCLHKNKTLTPRVSTHKLCDFYL